MPKPSKFTSTVGIVAIIVLGMGLLTWQAPNWLSRFYRFWGERLEDEQPKQAVTAYQQALDLKPTAPAYWGLSQAQINQHNWSAALDAMTEALRLDPQIAPPDELSQQLVHLGDRLSLFNIAESISAYTLALEQQPAQPKVLVNLAQKYLAVDQPDAAITALKQAIKLAPNFAIAHFELGEAYFAQEDYDRSIPAYALAVDHEPRNSEFRLGHGKALAKAGRHPGAIAVYKKLLTLQPDNALAYEGLCLSYHARRRYQQAIQSCQRAVIIDDSLSTANFYLDEVPRAIATRQLPADLSTPSEIVPIATREDRLKRSIVKILVRRDKKFQVGTGWIIKRTDSTAWILTNRHVVIHPDLGEPERLEVELFSTPPPGQFRQRKPAEILHHTENDDWLDVAVLKVEDLPSDLQALNLADGETSLFQALTVIGHPKGQANWSVDTGPINAQNAQNIQLGLPLAQGSSGSPAFNEQNQVVGMINRVGFFCQQQALSDLSPICAIAQPSSAIKAQLAEWGIVL
ncbi:MAG: tetratricopeptide repeat protein [Cyanobacteria bacterium P01_H01_bin.15]